MDRQQIPNRPYMMRGNVGAHHSFQEEIINSQKRIIEKHVTTIKEQEETIKELNDELKKMRESRGLSDRTPNLTKRASTSNQPVTLRKDQIKQECTIWLGSRVKVERNGTKFGIIKWIGYVSDPKNVIAGIEMEQDSVGKPEARAGKLNGYQLFECTPGKGMFIHLHKCKPVIEEIKLPERDCLSCGDTYPLNEMHSLTFCECLNCTECFVAGYRVLIQSKSVQQWNCMFCGQPDLNDSENRDMHFRFLSMKLQSIIDDDMLFELFTKKLNQWKIQNSPNFIWCANDKCDYGFLWDGNIEAKCPHCKQSMCSKCKIPWPEEHKKRTCQDYKAWLRTQEESSDIRRRLQEYGINCPKCDFKYELARGGCMHFTCGKCKYEFCGGCFKKFSQQPGRGLYCDHPRDCFSWLRDWNNEKLEALLRDNQKPFSVNPEIAKGKTKCPVIVTEDLMTEKPCGKTIDKSGLCQLHYKEHLVHVINKYRIDPIDKMDTPKIIDLLKRENIHFDEDESSNNLINLVKNRIPLQQEPYQ